MLKVKLFTFNPVQENTYVIYNEQGWCAIVDPGCYFDYEEQELQNFVGSAGLSPKYLLNTHCHLDHVFGNRFVSAIYQLPLWLHDLERPMLEIAPASGRQWGLPFEGFEGELRSLSEGDQVVLGDDTLDILFTPGHSPGHVCFYCAAGNFLLGGDVLFRGSIGRTDLPGGDHETLLQSIREKLFTLPDSVIVYPGHGPSTTIGFEKKNNPFLVQAAL